MLKIKYKKSYGIYFLKIIMRFLTIKPQHSFHKNILDFQKTSLIKAGTFIFNKAFFCTVNMLIFDLKHSRFYMFAHLF